MHCEQAVVGLQASYIEFLWPHRKLGNGDHLARSHGGKKKKKKKKKKEKKKKKKKKKKNNNNNNNNSNNINNGTEKRNSKTTYEVQKEIVNISHLTPVSHQARASKAR